MPSEKTSWDGDERRLGNATSAVTALKIAARAAEGSPLDVNQMFDASDEPRLNNVRPEDYENPRLRYKVAAILRAAAADNVEIVDGITELVDAQYQGSLDTLKFFGLFNPEQIGEGDVPVPTLAQAKEILANNITPEQLQFIKKMKIPGLQLVPITSMARYLEALNRRKLDGQVDAQVSNQCAEAFARADERDGVAGNNTIIGWRIAITEGENEPALFDGDDTNMKLEKRIARFEKQFGRNGIYGVDFKRMIISMLRGLKDCNPVNDYFKQSGTYTVVNEEPEDGTFVFIIAWHHIDYRTETHNDLDKGHVAFEHVHAGLLHENARLRASVIVDVPKV
jgi:hypothetical protein